MPARFSAFGRVFSPSWPMTLVTLVLLAVFVSLGRWQWQRGEAKQAVWAEFQRASDRAASARAGIDDPRAFSRICVAGSLRARTAVPARQSLARGTTRLRGADAVRYRRTADGILVNRGWIPFTGYRDRLPEVSIEATRDADIHGRVEELPAPGSPAAARRRQRVRNGPSSRAFPLRRNCRPSIGVHPSRVAHPCCSIRRRRDGYVREWKPPGLDPSRHFSYAIQWWGFAAVLLVLYFGLNFRRVS